MEFSLAAGERGRLASLLAATTTLLLLVFVLAVALPLLPLKLADPFWQLAFSGALCTNGFLALLAVLLLNLAAALLPEADWLVGRRQLVGRLCRWVAFAFVLLIPLQGWAAWQALDRARAIESRGALEELSRIAQFRQAVLRAGSVSALQANLLAIQAPPLGREDQALGLKVIKANLLRQLQVAEQRARSTASTVPVQATAQPSSVNRRTALLKDSLRTVLLSLGLALGFAAAAQRKGSGLSMRDECELAVVETLGASLAWRDSREQRRLALKDQPQGPLKKPLQDSTPSSSAGPPRALPGAPGWGQRGVADGDYFNALAGEQDEPPVP